MVSIFLIILTLTIYDTIIAIRKKVQESGKICYLTEREHELCENLPKRQHDVVNKPNLGG